MSTRSFQKQEKYTHARTRTYTRSALLLCVLKHVQNYYCVLCLCVCERERDSIRHAFSADIINRLIIWQLGRALRQRRSVLCQANEQTQQRAKGSSNKKEHTHTRTHRQGMKADRQRTDGRGGRHCGPGKSKLSSLLPRLLATATAAAVVVVVARGLVHV